MTLLRLPPLLGLPWERPRNGDGLGMLESFAVTGAPLTKLVGQPVRVRWGVRNTGGASGYVELYLKLFPWFARTGPLVAAANTDTLVSLGWQTGEIPAGTHTVTIRMDEVTPLGVYVRNLGTDAFLVTFSAPGALLPGVQNYIGLDVYTPDGAGVIQSSISTPAGQ